MYTEDGYLSRLPSPRVVSSNLMMGGNVSDDLHSHVLMQFGQFLDHDISSNSKKGKRAFPPPLDKSTKKPHKSLY